MVSILTPVGQLCKLPFLVEHYIKHQKLEGVSLIDFLETHYLANHQDADLPEDEQLPFKILSYYNIGFAIVTPTVQANVDTLLLADNKIVFPATYSLQQHLQNIFHPPRV